ncbi:putative late blight resistance protein homolog R1B-23 isoform X2 [Olea europaea var. sylvestris]|uniref:putative late blight resistance protein homolog R1B-23 isoform X2 n=1 Tax=Olea europaea var. sylvestris TaxID=158386 RepID=UPI000C1CD9ED|nr:putative late blight resistance protein homolog R1B-23 isoform X2 [Olea europaea var. sylvestris]
MSKSGDNMLTTGSQIHDCYEHYELKTYEKLFWCDGCKMNGFGEWYTCNLCGHGLHKDCRQPKSKVSHENFGGSIFKFHYKPFTRLGKKYRREFSRICDACGKVICGFNYHCEEENLDLHPCCGKLVKELVIDGMIFDLEAKLSSKCGMCGQKKIPRVENNVPGWSYVSQCKRYHFHVYCMTEMLHESHMNSSDLALENMNFREFSNHIENSLKGDEKFETFVLQRILVSTIPVYMEPCVRYDLEIDLPDELKLSAISCKISRSPQAYRAFFELLMSTVQDLRVVFTIPKQRMSKITPTPHPNEVVMVFIDFLVQLLEEIMRLEPDFIVPVKGSIKNLQTELEFLISFLGDAPLHTEVDVTKNILSDIEVVVNEVGSFLYSLFSTRDDRVLETVRLSFSLSDFLQKFEILKTKIKEHCTTVPKLPGCVATKSSVISFFTVDSLLDDLEDLINYKADRIVPAKDQIITLYEKMSSLRSTLNYMAVERHLQLEDLAMKTRYLAYEISYVINSVTPASYLTLRLSQLLEKIHLVKMAIQEKKSSSIDAGIPEEEYPCEQVQPQAKELNNLEDDLVGFKDEKTKISDQLTSGPLKQQIISIVGMPGLGAECWELLQRKVFQTEPCPPELQGIGQHIASRCHGLPMSVIMISSILANMQKKESSWGEIARHLNAHIFDSTNNCVHILKLSFQHLSVHLKLCFLYFGVFEEDEVIPVQKLISLWVAEGFINKETHRSSEDVALDYLVDLINRGLVLVAEERSNGGVKACRIHDLLHDLCLRIAKEENFMGGIENGYSKCKKDKSILDMQRLCFLRPFDPYVHSQLGRRVMDLSGPYWDSFISCSFKDVREGIENLVHLRYLKVQEELKLPLIEKLHRLEYLHVENRDEVEIPDFVLNMKYLKRLHFGGGARFSESSHLRATTDGSFQINNLQSISTLLIHNEIDAKVLGCAPNLRKLKCKLVSQWPFQFPNQLESLEISLMRDSGPDFPLNLKKLTLLQFDSSWEKIRMIGRLPNLEVLKLRNGSFKEKQWDTEVGEFQKLKFFELNNVKIASRYDCAEWNPTSDDYPKLERLVLRNCYCLNKIPSSLGYILTLQKIEVYRCGDSIAKSAVEIREEQEEMGNEELKVIISHRRFK